LAQKYALPFDVGGKMETKRTPALFSTKYIFYFNMYEKNPAVFMENAGFIICTHWRAGMHGSPKCMQLSSSVSVGI